MKDNSEIKYQGEPIVPKHMLHSSIKNTEPKIIYVRRLAAAFEED